jgi:5-methylcytosine-specific restriction endonuclease McrA
MNGLKPMKHVVRVKPKSRTRYDDGYYVSAEWRAVRKLILLRDQNTCWMCGKWADTVDHLVARSKGGSNDPSNLAAACKKCNYAKKANGPSPLTITIDW